MNARELELQQPAFRSSVDIKRRLPRRRVEVSTGLEKAQELSFMNMFHVILARMPFRIRLWIGEWGTRIDGCVASGGPARLQKCTLLDRPRGRMRLLAVSAWKSSLTFHRGESHD